MMATSTHGAGLAYRPRLRSLGQISVTIKSHPTSRQSPSSPPSPPLCLSPSPYLPPYSASGTTSATPTARYSSIVPRHPPTTIVIPLSVPTSSSVSSSRISTHQLTPLSLMEEVRRFLYHRFDTPAILNADQFCGFTRKFHDISEPVYRAIRRELFPGEDTHPGGARINYYSDRQLIIITIPGLPHELMGRFDVALSQSLIAQGFLWPTWPTERLASSGSARISLTHNKTIREFEPDAGLQILTQKFPFLVVEVADSQGYGDALEKVAWMLKYSKGKIRFAILIKLHRKVIRRYPVALLVEITGNKHSLSDCDVDASVDSSPPALQRKRVRTVETGSSLSETDGTTFEATLGDHSVSVIVPHDPRLEDTSPHTTTSSSDLSSFHSSPDSIAISADHPTVSATATVATSTLSSSPISPPSSSQPHNPRALFSKASVTVLGSTLTGTHRDVTTLLACSEFWPTPPSAEDVFSFGWEDMPAPSFPVAMQGRRFTVRFDALHRLLDEFVKTGDPVWCREQGSDVLEEYSDRSDDAGDEEDEDEEGKDVEEDDDDNEEEQEEDSAAGDGDYVG